MPRANTTNTIPVDAGFPDPAPTWGYGGGSERALSTPFFHSQPSTHSRVAEWKHGGNESAAGNRALTRFPRGCFHTQSLQLSTHPVDQVCETESCSAASDSRAGALSLSNRRTTSTLFSGSGNGTVAYSAGRFLGGLLPIDQLLATAFRRRVSTLRSGIPASVPRREVEELLRYGGDERVRETS